MGVKGEKRTGAAKEAADDMVERLASLGPVAARGMFGGYGINLDGAMFALVDSAGVFHLRVDDATRARLEKAGGVPHGKMPYVSVPGAVLKDTRKLTAWAEDAVAIAQSSKKR